MPLLAVLFFEIFRQFEPSLRSLRRGSTYPTLFFGGDASRAGTGRPGTLVFRRFGAFRCYVVLGGDVPRDKLITKSQDLCGVSYA